MADGHLNFDTKIDESGFSGGVKKLGSIAKSGLGILSAAVGGAASAMGAGLAAGMKYNSTMEDYMANFETLLGSADAATAHVNELKEFASKTPFEMKDLAEGSKTLLAFGTDTQKVMPVMKQLGDISLGNSEKFSSLALVYGQVSSQGKLMGQDLMQMVNAGFNPLLEISKHTGESMESLKDKMSKGEIGVEELDQALKWATESGGQFAGGMEKASQTMSGQISTLKDNAMALLGEVVEPISQNMTETLLPAAISAIDGLSTAFKEDGVDGLIEAGASVVTNLLLGIAEQLPTVIETALSIIEALITSIGENAPALAEAGASILTTLITGVLQLLPQLAVLALQLVTSFITALAANAPTIISQGSSTLTQFINGILLGLPGLIKAAGELITALVNGLVQALPTLIGYLPTIISTILDGILSGLPQILQSGCDLLLSLISGIAQTIPQLVGEIPEIISAFIDTIGENLPQILETGVTILGELIAGIIQAIPDLIGAIPDVVSAIWDTIMETDWLSLGANIISGIASGIANGAGAIIEAAKSAASNALQSAKDFLGIKSPSRRFRDEVGLQMAKGLGIGFVKNMPTNEMNAEVQNAMDTIRTTAEEPIFYNPSRSLETKTEGFDYERLEEMLDKKEDKNTTIVLDDREIGRLLKER